MGKNTQHLPPGPYGGREYLLLRFRESSPIHIIHRIRVVNITAQFPKSISTTSGRQQIASREFISLIIPRALEKRTYLGSSGGLTFLVVTL